MDNKQYNGWHNYATWRVNLEIFDGMDWGDYSPYSTIADFADALEEMADEVITNYGEIKDDGHHLPLDYARAFLLDVDWYEIAEHIAQDYPNVLEQVTCDECGESTPKDNSTETSDGRTLCEACEAKRTAKN